MAVRRWTLNGDFVALEATGVARHGREVTVALDRLVGEGHPLTRDLEVTLVAPRDPTALGLRHIASRVVAEFDRPRLPQIWVQLQLPRHVRGGLVSFSNLAPLAVRQQIVCIHDLNTRLTPDSYGAAFRLAHRLLLPRLGRRARIVATVSAQARADLIAHRVAAAERIHVVSDGADHAAAWRADGGRLRLPERPFVLGIGRRQAHKNTALIWRLAPALAAAGIDVVLAGDPDPPAVVPPNVHLVGRIDDGALAAAMDRALCLVFPSRVEGFGLPAVEAMARGCAVVVSKLPVLAEVCGDAALCADPDDVDGWLGAIGRLRDDRGLRAEWQARGRAWAARYTWRAVAERYLALMAQVDG
jgi:glycosyltransferase involved in cell wall biosynthesis